MRILHFVVLIGLLPGIYCVSVPYPPLDSGPVLASVAILYVCAVCIVIGAPLDGGVTAKYVAISLSPWLIAALFLANGAFDRSGEVLHQTTVVESHYYLHGWTIVVVQSWRPGRGNESLYVKTWLLDKRGFYLEGEPLTVGVKSGALAMPWISRISRNGRMSSDRVTGSRARISNLRYGCKVAYIPPLRWCKSTRKMLLV